MSKVSGAFKNGKAFIAFITGGDPDLETTKKLILEIKYNRMLQFVAFYLPLRPSHRTNHCSG